MTSVEIKDLVLKYIDKTKAENVVVIDVRQKTSITDFLVIASGNSSRQVNSIVANVEDSLKQDHIKILGKEGADAGEWVLLDLGEVVLHLMQPATREYYDLEKLWSF